MLVNLLQHAGWAPATKKVICFKMSIELMLKNTNWMVHALLMEGHYSRLWQKCRNFFTFFPPLSLLFEKSWLCYLFIFRFWRKLSVDSHSTLFFHRLHNTNLIASTCYQDRKQRMKGLTYLWRTKTPELEVLSSDPPPLSSLEHILILNFCIVISSSFWWKGEIT